MKRLLLPQTVKPNSNLSIVAKPKQVILAAVTFSDATRLADVCPSPHQILLFFGAIRLNNSLARSTSSSPRCI